MKKNKNKKSFRAHLKSSFLMISIIPLLLILGIVFFNTLHDSMKNAQTKMDITAELISVQLNSLIENMRFIGINLVGNQEVINAARNLGNSQKSIIKEQEYYRTLCLQFCSYAIVDSPYTVKFFNDDGYYITSDKYNIDYNYRYRLSKEEENTIDWKSKVAGNFGDGVLLNVQEKAMPLDHVKTLTMVRAIRNPGKNVGYLGVQVGTDYLDNIFMIGMQEENSVFMIKTDSNEVIYTSEGASIQEYYDENGAIDFDILEKTYLVAIEENEGNNIMTILLRPKSQIYAGVYREMLVLSAEMLTLVLITLIFVIVYSQQLTKPIRNLTRYIQNTTSLDNFAETEPLKHNIDTEYEEIKSLYLSYSEMSRKINILLQNEITNKTIQMREKLNSLQSQINPHFLYNTLNVIGILGMEQGNNQIYKSCYKLSAILRYSIADKNRNITTIKKEMDNLNFYLELMKLRFEHRLEYQLICDEEIEGVELPRLTLQPFVENVFEHAIDERHTEIQIVIKGLYEPNNRFVISIEDNGAGMDKEELEEMKREISRYLLEYKLGKNIETAYGIGVRNTILRLAISYGDTFSYTIENLNPCGFRISLSAERKGEHNE
ncbi:MAG: histidine kinase [Lachnospiraceae bacterium]